MMVMASGCAGQRDDPPADGRHGQAQLRREVPKRSPDRNDQQLPADAEVPEPTWNHGLTRALADQIQSNPVFQRENSSTDPLIDILTQADELLTEAKRRNREALRQLNRQVRVGAARLSPHLIVILADRVSPAEINCYRDLLDFHLAEQPKTPTFDELSARGATFLWAYAADPNPNACFWSFMTGRNPSVARKSPDSPSTEAQEDPWLIREQDQTLSEVLWRAGYSTAFVGIWQGEGVPTLHGFDDWVGRLPTPASIEAYPQVLLTTHSQMHIVENKQGKQHVDLMTLLSVEAESSLQRLSEGSRPWALIIRLPPRETVAVGLTGQAALASDPQVVQAYDTFVGKVMKKLQSLNLQRRTCVLLTSLGSPHEEFIRKWAHAETSGMLGDYPLSESRLRVPLIVVWPGGIPADYLIEEPVAQWDLTPTLYNLAAVTFPPKDLPGVVLTGMLRRKEVLERPHPLFWESRTGNGRMQMVRWKQWKGVAQEHERGLRVFDLATDPHETTDVADKHPDIVEKFVVKPRQGTAKSPRL